MLKIFFASLRSYVDSDEIWFNEVVRSIFIYSFLTWSSKAVYDGNVQGVYLFTLVGNHNTEVGVAGGITGITGVVLAPIIGILSDKYGRTILLKASSITGYIAMIVTTYAIQTDNYQMVLVANLFFGAFWALSNPTMDALLADSVEPGTRSRVYTLKVMVLQIASAVGPLLSIFLFLYLGNEWDMDTCRIVMCVGLALFVLPVTLLLLIFPSSFDNYQSNILDVSAYDMLPKQSTHGHQDVQDATEEMGVELQATEAAVVSPTEAAVVSPIEADTGISSVTVDADKIIDSAAVEVESLYCSYSCCSNLLLVPAMIAGSDVITGLASGMTVKFFPIFFLFVLDLKPIEVQIIYLLTPFAIAFNAPILQEFSKKHGRITVTCIVKSLGVCLLLLLAFLTLETTDNKETLPHESFVDDDNWIDGGTDKSGNIPQEK